MSDQDNKQWFEQRDQDKERRRSRTGGKKPANGAPKAPADPARRKRKPDHASAPDG